MGSCGGAVAVVVKSTEVVAAVLPVADSWLAMSNLDLLLPPLDVGIFLCYNNEMSGNNEKMIGMVKKGLAEVLVSFYPLAGEVVINKEGEPEVHCNNRGVDFAQAFADIDLQHLDLYNPDVSIDANFVPIKKHGVLSVQVTRMKCGGLVIGCSFDHRVADAHSINKFLVAWADATTSNYFRNEKNLNNNNNNNNIPTLFTPGNYKYMKNTPCYRRSLLNPRRPGHHDAVIEDMYILIKAAAAAAKNSSQKPQQQLLLPPSFQLESRIYQISAGQIQNLQSEAGPERSKFESFSALLWQLLAKAGKEDTKTCKLGIVVDGRKCLARSASSSFNNNNNNNNNKISSMENYFGNVLSVPYIEASVGELKSLSLSKTAKLVHQCVESAANEEHFRGLVDWVEDQRPNQAMSKIYSSVPGETDEVAVVVSSGQRFPVSQFDFGWGLPCFGSYHFPWGGYTGYVMPMPSVANNGDWIVYMHLFPKHLLFIEKEAPHIFTPFIF